MEQLLPQIDVSIIIVNFNSFQMLEKCLNSIFSFCNSTTNEVILVDNASTEGDIETITNKFSNLTLIKNRTNIGFAAANNKALTYAKGKYSLFLNNDTLFTEDSIKVVFDFVEKYSGKLFVGVQLLNSDGTKQESVVQFPSIWNGFTENFFLYKLFPKSKLFNKYYQNYNDYKNPVEVDVIRGAFMFCPTHELKKLNGFDDRFFFYSEETDLCKRFKDNGGKIIFYPDTSIIHYGGATADSNLWFKFKNQTVGKIQYYQKHFTGMNFILSLLLHWIGLLLRFILFTIGGVLSFNKGLLLKGYYFFRQLFVYPQNKFVRL
ncbi:MAG: glycosyltransferase family 2 protein [Ignavibacteria bacterium]|nr:glycosyltransferase family 2 protein [Ignavibacteria bacterium]